MSYNRHRRDGSQKAIVERLLELGCSVRDVSQSAGNGEPDLIAGICGFDFQIEVKSHGNALSPEQLEFHVFWRGARPVTLWDTDQATSWVNDVRRRLRGVKTAAKDLA